MYFRLAWSAVIVIGLLLGILHHPTHACACGNETQEVTWTERISGPEGIVFGVFTLGIVLMGMQIAAAIWLDTRQHTPD